MQRTTTTTIAAQRSIALHALLLYFVALIANATTSSAQQPTSLSRSTVATTAAGNNRIIIDYRMHNGRTIKNIEAAPFMVFLSIRSAEEHAYFACGGSVIGERRIVTAAHCVTFDAANSVQTVKPEDVVIKAGTADRLVADGGSDTSLVGLILTRAKRIIVHPDWTGTATKAALMRHDIAIVVPTLQLYQTGGQQIVRPIALPSGAAVPGVGGCTATGWGQTQAGVLPQWLQQIDCEVLAPVECYRFGALHAEQLCVRGTNGTTADQGDSGGPMVCGGSGDGAHLVGVVSLGGAKASSDLPVVYTSVWEERNFVRNRAAVVSSVVGGLWVAVVVWAVGGARY